MLQLVRQGRGKHDCNRYCIMLLILSDFIKEKVGNGTLKRFLKL